MSTTLTIGTRIKNNEPGATTERTVTQFLRCVGSPWYEAPLDLATHVLARGPANTTRIRIDRIHTDGKPRRSGWSMVP